MELATRHFVRPEALNHHETAYAGKLADWLTEAAMIGVTKEFKRNDNLVLGALKEIRLLKPVVAGMILEFYYKVGHVGTTSIEIQVELKNMLSEEIYGMGSAIFVCVNEQGEKTPHGGLTNEK